MNTELARLPPDVDRAPSPSPPAWPSKAAVRARIEDIGVIAALRVSSAGDALFAAEAVSDGGIPIIEVAGVVPRMVNVIYELTRQNGELIVGAGTVLDADSAHRCLEAGASFLTCAGNDPETAALARERGAVLFQSALTPTEIVAAWKSGCDFVKVFPCARLGGSGYVRTLQATFPQIPLLVADGVNQETAADFILAGAAAVGIGEDLIHRDAINQRERGRIRELARRYKALVTQARGQCNRRQMAKE